MDSVKYQEILGENVMPSVRKLKLGHHSNRTMIPSIPQSPTRLGFRRSPGKYQSGHQSPDLSPIGKSLVGFKNAVAARKPKNICELKAFAHEEWAKIPWERSQKLVSGYAMFAAGHKSKKMLY